MRQWFSVWHWTPDNEGQWSSRDRKTDELGPENPPAYFMGGGSRLWFKEESQVKPEVLPEWRRWCWDMRDANAAWVHRADNLRRESCTERRVQGSSDPLSLTQNTDHHMHVNKPPMSRERTTQVEEREPSSRQRQEESWAIPISQSEKFHNSWGTGKRTHLFCISSIK